ncbi:E3 ubiquitin-protein ligase RNF144A-like isoform X2 [Heterodontus francisci]|uniref:E3 ubiquitin-protein ligase RNF144A-like isoform X2 n=1 Tax=Heterodontus francisci TaxID=7792 RepID=UPI00355C1F71
MDTAQERHGASQGVCHLADTSSSSSLRAKASCGHITEPLSLKAWAKARIEMGIRSFPCQSCKKEWVWQEVCKLALFSEEERECYEQKLVELTKDDTASYKKCPDCNFLVQRVDLQSLCVECLFCSNARGKLYQFCWDCLREWKSPASHSTDCGNKSCTITAMLLSCPLIEAPDIEVHQCPVVRACPNCEALVSHCLEGCPQVECPNCFHSFCYRCLGIEECNYAEIVELSDDDDTDYENCDDSSECIRAGRQKITGRKNYKINPTYKLNEDVTDN